jgi:Uma2 family endonuclease
VTTSGRHEWRKEFILLIVAFLCDELKIPMQSFGQATWKVKRLRKGAEADTCVYTANLSRIVHRKDSIDLTVDPPPDIIVEIDVSSQSDRKFAIYAAFGVPEICRLKSGVMQFFELHGQEYVETSISRSFPILTNTVVTQFLSKFENHDQMATLQEFRQWVRAQSTPGEN